MLRPADFSVLFDDRLVAYIWLGEPGQLRRAGAKNDTSPSEIPYADILVFDATQYSELQRLVVASADFDALRFKLGLESFEIVPGEIKPDARRRRF